MIIFTKIRISIDYKVFILLNVHPAEYTNEIGNLTSEQYKEYISKLPINESKTDARVVHVDYTLEEELKRGAVLAEDF